MAPHQHPPSTRGGALATCAAAALTVLMCAALLSAAALVPAPPVVLPLIVVVCIGCPMAVAWELPAAIAALRPRLDARTLHPRRRIRTASDARHAVHHRRRSP
jgi:hypothetical protein